MPRKVTSIGIESTAHTFGIGLVTSDGVKLANEKESYIPSEGGIHPREAAQHHSNVAVSVLLAALNRAGAEPEDMDVVCFSQGPGLGPCLRVGATMARALSLALEKPLVGVNHCVAHIEIGRLAGGCADPVTLYVSGGNTLVSAFEGGRYRVFGETLDISANNCLDSFSIRAGLGFPGDVEVHPVEEAANRGGRILNIPYRVKGMDVSFSGLLTAAVRSLEEGEPIEDVSYTLVEVIYSMLAEVTERAVAHTGKEEVLLTGGGARSLRLRRCLEEICKDHGAKLHVVPAEYAGDNGAMVAWTGLLQYLHGDILEVGESIVKPRWRLDDVAVSWYGS